MSYSKWLKVDLHIHSDKSNETKENDYSGKNLTFERLVEALKKENVNIFSITDHNTINVPLYTELLERQQELISNNLNFIIGAEIDFFDNKIHDDEFHMLVYFNTLELTKIEKFFTGIYKKDSLDDIDKNVSPIDLNTFFEEVFTNDIQEIITIPHFNNKTKGIPPKDQIDKFVYTVFSALEDSNNRNRLIQSIRMFKNLEYADVPIVVFSDNHNIDIYPLGKNSDMNRQTTMYILGNVKYSFSSIKLAFQDVNTRISIDTIPMRRTDCNHKFVKSINIDEDSIPLSEYQNTIIGGFGSGKSFLLNMILKGKSNVDEQYKLLADKYENFTITFSDDTQRESLYQLSDEIKIIRFDQYKEIYFNNILLEQSKTLLEDYLHIEFPTLELIEEFDENGLILSVSSLKDNYMNTTAITDIINYDAISHIIDKSYSFSTETLQTIYDEPEYLEELKQNIDKEKEGRILNEDIYKDEEKQKLTTAKEIITQKNSYFNELSNKIDSILIAINEKIIDINDIAVNKNRKISSNIQIVGDIKGDLISYINLLKDLKVKSVDFENRYSIQKYNELKSIINKKELYSYYLIAKYHIKEEYQDPISCIFKNNCRKKESLFHSIIYTLQNDESFLQNQSFNQRMKYFTNKFYSNFKTVCYDIYDNEISIMKKSAGEKANTIINIIFDVIENYSSQGISSIVILDQPEDNLDNKGIQDKVVDRIRTMKINNCIPQFICVTHNANISITADSENIILAKKDDEKCHYYASGIEDTYFIDEVCYVVEGGQDALKRRGIKFNIPIIKELERGN